MIVIESYDMGDFEGSTLEIASKKFVECVAQELEEGEFSGIEEVTENGIKWTKKRREELEETLHDEIIQWREEAKIERAGYLRSQQDAVEGR
jgi:hypothetical protein